MAIDRKESRNLNPSPEFLISNGNKKTQAPVMDEELKTTRFGKEQENGSLILTVSPGSYGHRSSRDHLLDLDDRRLRE